ncbi:sugar ABC transporter permease [Clostridia bacterium]|nr:sugar ABC transporter permease [Clostridia bacterium]
MMLPGAIWLLLIRYLPMFGIVIAFKDYKVYGKDPTLLNNILHSAWSGLKNFEFMVSSTDAARMIRNTLAYNGVWIILTLVISVTFAVLLNEITKKFMAKTYQTMMFFPYFLSWVVVSYFVFAFLAPTDGLLSRALGTKDFYGDASVWPGILTIASLWKNIGYSCILYMAAIAGIDTSQYEAASMDGATKFQQVWHVTLPHLRTMIMILLILNVGRIFNADFGLFYSVPMNSGALYNATQVIDTYVYNALVNMHDTGMSTAAGLLQNVVGFIFIMATNQVAKKVDPDSALF